MPSFGYHLLEIYFPKLYFLPMYLLNAKRSLLLSAYRWILFIKIQSATLCFLTGKFSPFTFKLTINKQGLLTAFLLIVFLLFCSCFVSFYLLLSSFDSQYFVVVCFDSFYSIFVYLLKLLKFLFTIRFT